MTTPELNFNVADFIISNPNLEQWTHYWSQLQHSFSSDSFHSFAKDNFKTVLHYTQHPFDEDKLRYFFSTIGKYELWNHESLEYFTASFHEDNQAWCETVLDFMEDSQHHQDEFFRNINELINATQSPELILRALNIGNARPEIVPLHMVYYNLAENNLFNKMVFIEQHVGNINWDFYNLMQVSLNHDRDNFVHYLLTKIDCHNLSEGKQTDFITAVFCHQTVEMRDFLLNTIGVNLHEHDNTWQAYYMALCGGAEEQVQWLFEKGYPFYPEESDINMLDSVITNRKVLWEDLQYSENHESLINLVQCMYHYQPQFLGQLETELHHSVFQDATKIMKRTLLNIKINADFEQHYQNHDEPAGRKNKI
jgi:hypothetical protein